MDNKALFFFMNLHRWLVLDTETKDLVTVHTDGNEQLSVMRFSPGSSAFGKLLGRYYII